MGRAGEIRLSKAYINRTKQLYTQYSSVLKANTTLRRGPLDVWKKRGMGGGAVKKPPLPHQVPDTPWTIHSPLPPFPCLLLYRKGMSCQCDLLAILYPPLSLPIQAHFPLLPSTFCDNGKISSSVSKKRYPPPRSPHPPTVPSSPPAPSPPSPPYPGAPFALRQF